MFGVSTAQLLFFALIALLLFGSRLPSTMRSLGKSVNEFKRGLKEGEQEAEQDEEPVEKA